MYGMKRDFEIIEKAIRNLNVKIEKLIFDLYDTDLPEDDSNIIYNLEEVQKELVCMWQNIQIMKKRYQKG